MNQEDMTLAKSVTDLTDTAQSLADLLRIVDKSQRLLAINQKDIIELQQNAEETAEAVAHATTKRELADEIIRADRERKRDNLRTKLGIGGTAFIVISLLSALTFTVNEYKQARTEANQNYSAVVKNVCEERNMSWEAMQVWIRKQQALLARDMVTAPELKAERLAAYAELLKNFPDVDCSKLGTGLALLPLAPSGLSYTFNEAAMLWEKN